MAASEELSAVPDRMYGAANVTIGLVPPLRGA